ncbi:hypothetical protein [Methanomassiliicoccus luminyensis]|uniref:hypothetical protein n=1 Tax=Methanomassiliicoccus luminyensis TaxID=1080712 RepID=UPI00035C6848|nr:hypothetical protein [Methanomassiliicoccus luminyensis]
MAPLSPEERAAVVEALDAQLRKEPFEKALGRILRRRGLDFDRYVGIMSEIRERARKDKTSLEDAARLIAKEDRG